MGFTTMARPSLQTKPAKPKTVKRDPVASGDGRDYRVARPVSCIRWFGLAMCYRQTDPRRSSAAGRRDRPHGGDGSLGHGGATVPLVPRRGPLVTTGPTVRVPQGEHRALQRAPVTLGIGCRKQGGQPPDEPPGHRRGDRGGTPCAAPGVRERTDPPSASRRGALRAFKGHAPPPGIGSRSEGAVNRKTNRHALLEILAIRQGRTGG